MILSGATELGGAGSFFWSQGSCAAPARLGRRGDGTFRESFRIRSQALPLRFAHTVWGDSVLLITWGLLALEWVLLHPLSGAALGGWDVNLQHLEGAE